MVDADVRSYIFKRITIYHNFTGYTRNAKQYTIFHTSFCVLTQFKWKHLIYLNANIVIYNLIFLCKILKIDMKLQENQSIIQKCNCYLKQQKQFKSNEEMKWWRNYEQYMLGFWPDETTINDYIYYADLYSSSYNLSERRLC